MTTKYRWWRSESGDDYLVPSKEYNEEALFEGFDAEYLSDEDKRYCQSPNAIHFDKTVEVYLADEADADGIYYGR